MSTNITERHSILCTRGFLYAHDHRQRRRVPQRADGETPEINWSEVTRQAIREKIERLELMDELVADSELTDEDVEELARKINQSARGHLDEQRE